MDEPEPSAADRKAAEDDLIDEASEESFPASDPPAYRSMSVGGPAADGDRKPRDADQRAPRGS